MFAHECTHYSGISYVCMDSSPTCENPASTQTYNTEFHRFTFSMHVHFSLHISMETGQCLPIYVCSYIHLCMSIIVWVYTYMYVHSCLRSLLWKVICYRLCTKFQKKSILLVILTLWTISMETEQCLYIYVCLYMHLCMYIVVWGLYWGKLFVTYFVWSFRKNQFCMPS